MGKGVAVSRSRRCLLYRAREIGRWSLGRIAEVFKRMESGLGDSAQLIESTPGVYERMKEGVGYCLHWLCVWPDRICTTSSRLWLAQYLGHMYVCLLPGFKAVFILSVTSVAHAL